MRRRPSPESIITFAVLGLAVLFVFKQLRPGLLFTDTTPAGGDMGAHVWGPAYLRDHLLPHWRLTGWAPDWYLGFPALTFYFPLPSLLIVLLDVLLPYGVAFKLVTVLGVLSLPVAAWAFGRLAGVRFPGPALMGLATLPFLFDRFHTIYGGNISATLAGEFAFSISLSLGLVFLGVFARGLQTGRHRGSAAVLLALTALSHLLPTFFVLAGAAILFVCHRIDRHRLRWAGTALPVAGLLASFWALPFLVRLPYANDMGWEKITAYKKNLFPFTSHCVLANNPQCVPNQQFYGAQTAHLRWVVLLALAGALVSILLRRRPGMALTGMALAAAAAFRFLPQSRLWNARMLPFWFLCLYLLAAVAVAEVAAGAAVLVARVREARTEPSPWFGRAAPVLGLATVVVLTGLPLGVIPKWLPFRTPDRSFVPDWVRWNYEGYEEKAHYPEYAALVNTMAELGRQQGCGRAMWEYEPQEDRFGTPMALMLLPYWTDGCVASMEGLFFEAAASTPYHFLNQSELSKTPSNAQRDLPYRGLDVADGIRHLQLLGVRYYMAISPEAIAQADQNPSLTLLATSGPWRVDYPAPTGSVDRTWKVYEVAGGAAEVTPLGYEPAVVTGVARNSRAWLDVSVPWYTNGAAWDVPLAASGPKEWQRVAVHHEAVSENAPHVHGAGTTVDRPRRRPVRVTRISRIRTSDDRISFDVDRPRSPVLVKASYFPNWRVSGAKGPWRVTPNLMVVVPTARHVSLHYGRTAADWLGNVLAVIGVAALFLLRRRGPVVYPEPGVGVAAEEQLALDFEGAFVSGDGHGPGGEPPGAEPDTEPVAVPDRA